VELQAVVRKEEARRATSRARSVMLLMVFMRLGGVGGLGLFVVEAAVEVVGIVEFGVFAAGNDLTGVKDEDAVGVLNGAETVRNGEDGAAFCEGLEGGLDLVLTFGVEGGGGFVEYDDGGVFEEGAGDCDALALSAGEA
jgi:hypothetical protein